MKDKKTKLILLIVSLVVLVGLLVFVILNEKKDNVSIDAKKFNEEYKLDDEENVFVYRSAEEIIKILENGTGVVYLGFPECPWCTAYVKILNEVAKEEGLEKIYYYNILEDRKNNTENYKKIVSILNDNLLYDEEGNKRIFVPDVTFILKGEIVGHDNETSVMESGITPEEYWSEENKTNLKEKLRKLIIKVNTEICTSCNK